VYYNSYNPEFIAQGDIVNGQLRPDMILIGEGSTAAGDRMQSIYEVMCEVRSFVRSFMLPLPSRMPLILIE
jgi:UDP-glucose 6-dehydrogenase